MATNDSHSDDPTPNARDSAAGGHRLRMDTGPSRAEVVVAARRKRRPISLTARGEPMVWLTGGTVAVSIIMIVGLLAYICIKGFTTFWPSPLHQVTYKLPPEPAPPSATTQPSSTQPASHQKTRTILGEPFRSERYRPEGAAPGETFGRTLYRIGNMDVTGERFVWINDDSVTEVQSPKDAVLFERRGWGNAYGFVDAVAANGKLYTGVNAWPQFQKQFGPMSQKVEDLLHVTKHEMGEVSRRKNEIRLEILGVSLTTGKTSPEKVEEARKRFEAEIADLDKKDQAFREHAQRLTNEMSDVRVYVRTIEGQYISSERGTPDKAVTAGRAGKAKLLDIEPGVTATVDGGTSTILFHPEARQPRVEVVDDAGKTLESHIFWPKSTIGVKDGQEIKVGDTLGRQCNPLQVSQVVLAFQPNAQDGSAKTGTYFTRWWEFLSGDPRESNTEGGVFPAIIGTVLMTFIMIIFVVPIGVIAAIYLREYAKQGLLVTIIRISVNNLSGVPSIVFGVFGVAFFCNGLGKWIDAGPTDAGRLPGIPMRDWQVMLIVSCVLVAGALALSFLASRKSKDDNQAFPTLIKWGGIALWVTAACTIGYVVATMPFFKGLNWVEASENNAVVGKTALIWASLTLALLTLPVVIVATEEALSAVPRSMREGSYACGASKWQTIRRIVLPRAMPGIMTGMILAVARGAGEVAPLMLVGAVKWTEELPVALSAPFFGSDRSFMHLGFHIYDMGFQSPDSENARPLVFTTTFLLIAIVMLLNFSAMLIRSRLRKAHASGAF